MTVVLLEPVGRQGAMEAQAATEGHSLPRVAPVEWVLEVLEGVAVAAAKWFADPCVAMG